jgi:uncharacterized membrane protein
MAIILIALVIFVAGAVAGGFLLVVLGLREERRYFWDTGHSSLTGHAPGRISQAARPVTGLWARQQSDADPGPYRREDTLV